MPKLSRYILASSAGSIASAFCMAPSFRDETHSFRPSSGAFAPFASGGAIGIANEKSRHEAEFIDLERSLARRSSRGCMKENTMKTDNIRCINCNASRQPKAVGADGTLLHPDTLVCMRRSPGPKTEPKCMYLLSIGLLVRGNDLGGESETGELKKEKKAKAARRYCSE